MSEQKSPSTYLKDFGTRLQGMVQPYYEEVKSVAQDALSEGVGVGKTFALAKSSAIADEKARDAVNSAIDIAERSAHKLIGKGEKVGCYENWLGVTGGDCGCKNGWIGSDEMDLSTAKDYIESKNAKTKDVIIDEIIKVVDSLGLKVSGSTREEKVKSLLSVIPSGDKFNSSNEAHQRICKKVAEALNSIHGSQIINVSLAPELVCQQVAEIVSSLAAAMHSEFLAVYSDVRKILKNLEVLRKSIIDDHNEIKRRITSSDDANLTKETAQLSDLHKIITDEIERQIQLLQNLLNITLFPAERELASLIKGQKDIFGYIEKIDTKPGNKGFGKVISDILKGMGLTANFALLVDRALKTVGISVDEYVKMDTVGKLREKITSGLMGKQLDDSKVHEYLQSAELLYKNFYRKEEVAAAIPSGRSGQFEDNIADSDYASTERMLGGDDQMNSMFGGDDRYAKTVLDKRIADKRKLRNLIFTAFYRRLDDIYTGLMTSMETLAKKVGTEIPLSDQLDNFRHIVQRVDENLLRSKNVYQALIGYYSDALSKNRRDNILADLKMVSSHIDSLTEMSIYQSSAKYFKDVQAQINALFDVVNKFSDEIAAKFGKGEDNATEDKVGGDEFIDEPKTIIRSAKKIMDSFRKFDYYYRVAQIRANLGRTSKELDNYGEKYEKLVANSVANLLEKRKKHYEAFRKYLSDTPDAVVGGPTILVGGAQEFVNVEQMREEKANALKFLDLQWEATKKFWATVEAIDSYMRVFTDGLVKNPNDVQDIKSMLNDVEIISNWYNESAGDNIAHIFDMFPSSIDDTAAADTINITYPQDAILNDDGEHYYEKFASADGLNRASLPGNPFLMTNAGRALKARETVKKTMLNLSILKNLISVFVHIGSKFGGVELKSKIFMTPAQIYNNLVEFIQASAFQQGWIGFPDMAATTVPIPEFNAAAPDALYATGINLGCGINSNMTYVDAAIQDPTSWHANDLGALVGASTRDNASNEMRFRRMAGVIMTPVNGRFNRAIYDFAEERDYFVLTLKAIASKILTVTGMYDVLDRPLENNAISPIRMIMGGADETPKVDENVTELYLRLPLLAQFYKKIFGYDEDKGEFDENNMFANTELPGRKDRMIKISLVPDFDGVFAGFIRLLFRQIKYIGTKTYNDEDVKAIIREINLIYQRMQAKHPQNTITETINEFVAEVNRRYGIVSRDERNKFENAFGYRYDYYEGNTADGDRYDAQADVDVAILPGEGEEEVVRPSGAEKLLSGEAFADKDSLKSLYGITPQHNILLKRFRCAIDKAFGDHSEEHTFKNSIKLTVSKLKKESDDEKRLSIVAQLIRGRDALTKSDELKYFMFHETVVAGLNTLSAIHTLLSRFKRQILMIDLPQFEQDIMKYLLTPGSTVAVNDIRNLLAANVTSRSNVNDVDIGNAIAEIIGRGENFNRVGGTDAVANGYSLKYKSGLPAVISRDAVAPANVAALAAISANYPDVAAGHLTATDNIAAAPGGNTQTGLLGILTGVDLTVACESVKAGKNLTNQHAQALLTVFRYLPNYEHVMKLLLESVFAISNDSQGLITLKVNSGNISVNFGPIKALVEELFTHVNYFLDVLRPHINSDLIKKYTEKTNPGSFYWLQEQLMEKLIYGRPEQQTVTNAPGRSAYINIDDIGRKVNNIFVHLTKEHSVDGRGLLAAGRSLVSPATPATKRNHYDKVFADMIYYNSAVENSGIRNNDASTSAALIDFKGVEQPYETLHFAGVPDKKMLDTRFIVRFKQLYSWDKVYKPNRSLLFSYNQMVAKYIRCFYDNLTQKMYSGLIVQQLNGPLNRAINDYKSTYPDVVPAYVVKAERDLMRYPNTQLFEPEIDRDNAYNLFRRAITELLTRGIGTTKSLKDRTALLDPTNPDWFADLGAVPFMPQIYLSILIYAIAIELDRLTAAGGLLGYQPAFGAITNTLATGTIADARAALTAKNANTYVEYVAKLTNAELMASLTAIFTGTLAVPAGLGTIARAPNAAADTAYVWTTDLVGGQITSANTPLRIMFDRYLNPRIITGLGAGPVVWNYAKNLFTESAKLNFPFYKDMVSDNLAIQSRIEMFCAIVHKFGQVRSESIALLPAVGMVPVNALYNNYRELVRKSLITAPTVVVNKKAEPRTYLKHEELLTYLNTEFDEQYVDFTSPQSFIRIVSSDADGHSGPGDAWSYINVPKPVAPINRATMLQFGRRIDPDEDHVLYTSLSVILKTLFLTRNAANNTSIYLVDNIADINQYMKERFRANLPLFKMYFKEISDKCEYLRQIMGQENVSVERVWTECAGGQPTFSPWPFNLLQVTASSVDTKRRFTSILNGISTHAKSFMAACDQVLRELSDDPKFMELSQGFIKEYKSQYGVDPLMPLSSVLTIFRNVHSGDDDLSLPVHFQGDKLFKFVYGSRLLLNQPSIQPLPDHVPGWSAACEQFNMMIDTKQQADKAKADAFVKSLIRAVRFVYGAKFIRGNITPFMTQIDRSSYLAPADHYYAGMFARDNFIVTSGTYQNPGVNRVGPIAARYDANTVMRPSNRSSVSIIGDVDIMRTIDANAANKIPISVFGISSKIDDTLQITEGGFRNEQIKSIINHLIGKKVNDVILEIQNIVDLNIIPINVHALMREIPLVNIYNYSYTFDRLIMELYYGIGTEEAKNRIAALCNDPKSLSLNDSRDVIVKLLLDPFVVPTNVNDNGSSNYYEKIRNMMLGDASLDMGRPKFLSDQLLNKSLFGEMYERKADYNPVGPANKNMRRTGAPSMPDAMIGFNAAAYRFDAYTIGIHRAFVIEAVQFVVKNNVDLSTLMKMLTQALVRANAAGRLDVTYGAMFAAALPNEISNNYVFGVGWIAMAFGIPYRMMLNGEITGNVAALAATDAIITLNMITLPAPGAAAIININGAGGAVAPVDNNQLRKLLVLRTVVNIGAGVGTAIAQPAAVANWAHQANLNWIAIYNNIPAAQQTAALTSLFNTLKKMMPLFVPSTFISGLANDRSNINTALISSVLLIGNNLNTNQRIDPAVSELHWLKTPDGDGEAPYEPSQVKSVSVSNINKQLFMLSRMRFDTVFIRNLVFIVNLYRTVRHKLQKDLTYNRDIIASSQVVTKPSITEFSGNQTYQLPSKYLSNQRYKRYQY